jgi:hypothetical protein
MNYIRDIKNEFDQCQSKLTQQSQSYPIVTLSLDQIDQCLKELVNHYRKYLSTKNTKQLDKFKQTIHTNDLFQSISTNYSTTNEQVNLSIDSNKFFCY